MKEDIRTVEFASLLYDFYGTLLSENQEEIMKLYHEDNLSLSEIAEEIGQTRQAVHYTLKKAEAKLEEYENKLGLVAKYKNNERKLQDARDIARSISSDETLGEECKRRIDRLLAIIEELAE